MVTELFLILFLGASILVVVEHDLLNALIFLALGSLMLVVLVFMYRALDVALTFAVVNSAASTILFLVVIKKMEGRDGSE